MCTNTRIRFRKKVPKNKNISQFIRLGMKIEIIFPRSLNYEYSRVCLLPFHLTFHCLEISKHEAEEEREREKGEKTEK